MRPERHQSVGFTVYLWRGMLLIAVLAVLSATFLFPTALAVAAVDSIPLGLVIGVVVFPGLPLGWNINAEVRGAGPRRMLRRVERVVFRTGICCATILGLVIFGWGGDAWVALQHARVRAGFGHSVVPLAGEPVLADFGVATVASIPADAIALFAIPPSSAFVEEFAERNPAIEEVAKMCRFDLSSASILGAVSADKEVMLIAHVPGLTMRSMRCFGVDEEREATDLWGGYRLAAGDSISADELVVYALDFGGVALVSNGWTRAFEKRLAGGGEGMDPGLLRRSFDRVEGRRVDGWFVGVDWGDESNGVSQIVGWMAADRHYSDFGLVLEMKSVESAQGVLQDIEGGQLNEIARKGLPGVDLKSAVSIEGELHGADVHVSLRVHHADLAMQIIANLDVLERNKLADCLKTPVPRKCHLVP